MSDLEYDKLKMREIERICVEDFRLNLNITKLIITDVATLNNSYTTIFKSGHKMYALCQSKTPMTLREVKSSVRLMGMEADEYIPPMQDSHYFTRFGRQAFMSVFPGREVVSDEDMLFYQTLAPYSPALIRIRKVNGQIRRYNQRSSNWQPTLNFSFIHPQVQ